MVRVVGVGEGDRVVLALDGDGDRVSLCVY